jgi:hypothetical protein
MEWIGADVCFASWRLLPKMSVPGTRPLLCSQVLWHFYRPLRVFLFLFLFGATADASQRQAEAIVCCLCSINLTDFIYPFHPISVSLYPSAHERRFLSSSVIPVVFVAAREVGRRVSTNIRAFKILSNYLSAFRDVTVN